MFKKFIISFCVIMISLNCILSTQNIKYESVETYTNEKVNIRFASSLDYTDTYSQTMQEILDDYMYQSSNVNIISETLSEQTYLLKLKTDFASGNEPDIFSIYPGVNVKAFIDSDRVLELTQELKKDSQWFESVDKSVWKYTTFNGKSYGIPLDLMYICVYVNNDIFEKYGINIPKTFEELKDSVVKLRNEGVVPIAYNASSQGDLLYQSIAANLAGKWDCDKVFDENGQVEQHYLKAGEYLKELYDLNAFPENLFYITDNQVDDMFLNKEAAMIVHHSMFVQKIIERQLKDISIMPFPHIEGASSDPSAILYGCGKGMFFISKGTEKDVEVRDECINILKFVTNQKNVYKLVEKTGMMSAIKLKDVPQNYYLPYSIMQREYVEKTKEILTLPDTVIEKEIWNELVSKQIPFVLTDKKTIKEIWNEVKNAYVNEGYLN